MSALGRPSRASEVAVWLKLELRKFRAGEVASFTGVSDPYEPSRHPDLVIASGHETLAESTAKLVALLVTRRVCAPTADTNRQP